MPEFWIITRIGREPLAWYTALTVSTQLALAGFVFALLEPIWTKTVCETYDLGINVEAFGMCAASFSVSPIVVLTFFTSTALVCLHVYINRVGQPQTLRNAILEEKKLVSTLHTRLTEKKLEEKLGEKRDTNLDMPFFWNEVAPQSQKDFVKYYVQTTYTSVQADRMNLVVKALLWLNFFGSLWGAVRPSKFTVDLGWCLPSENIDTLLQSAPLFSSLQTTELTCHRSGETILPHVLLVASFVLAKFSADIFTRNCGLVAKEAAQEEENTE